jgi:hypothetical protein
MRHVLSCYQNTCNYHVLFSIPSILLLLLYMIESHCSRLNVSLISLGPRANAEMVPAFPSCLYMLLM